MCLTTPVFMLPVIICCGLLIRGRPIRLKVVRFQSIAIWINIPKTGANHFDFEDDVSKWNTSPLWYESHKQLKSRQWNTDCAVILAFQERVHVCGVFTLVKVFLCGCQSFVDARGIKQDLESGSRQSRLNARAIILLFLRWWDAQMTEEHRWFYLCWSISKEILFTSRRWMCSDTF